MMKQQEALEAVVKKAENLLAAASLPISAETHKEGLEHGLREILDIARRGSED